MLRYPKGVHTLLADFDSGQEVLWLLVPLLEFLTGFEIALHFNIAKFGMLDRLVNSPSAKDALEVAEIHPENIIIADLF